MKCPLLPVSSILFQFFLPSSSLLLHFSHLIIITIFLSSFPQAAIMETNASAYLLLSLFLLFSSSSSSSSSSSFFFFLLRLVSVSISFFRSLSYASSPSLCSQDDHAPHRVSVFLTGA